MNLELPSPVYSIVNDPIVLDEKTEISLRSTIVNDSIFNRQSSMNHLLIFNIGGSEFFLIILVVLLFFGAKGIPDIAKSLGRASREFKDAMSGVEREIRDAANTNAPPAKKEEPQKIQDGPSNEKLENGNS